VLSLAPLEMLNAAQGVGRGDSANRADAVRGIDDFSLRIQDKICGVNYLSSLLKASPAAVAARVKFN
jgi:hypothetical protein